MDLLRGVGEVRVDLELVEVAHDEQRRVVKGLAVLEQLRVRRPEVLVHALVLPREPSAAPDVREPVAAAGLLGTLLKGVEGAVGIGLVRRRLPEHPAQVDEVFLCSSALRGRVPGPLVGEFGRRHRHGRAIYSSAATQRAVDRETLSEGRSTSAAAVLRRPSCRFCSPCAAPLARRPKRKRDARSLLKNVAWRPCQVRTAPGRSSRQSLSSSVSSTIGLPP